MAGPGGLTAGRASVMVVPDLSRWAPALKKFLERVERTTRVRLPAELDPRGIQDDVEGVQEQVRRSSAKLPLLPDADQFLRRAQVEVAAAVKTIEAQIPLTSDGEQFRRKLQIEIQAIQARADELAVKVPVDPADAVQAKAELLAQIQGLQALATANGIEIPVDVNRDTSKKLSKIRKDVDGVGSSLTTVSGQLAVTAASVGSRLLTWGPPILLAAGAVAAMAPALLTILPLVAGLGAGFAVGALGAERLGKAFKPLAEGVKTLQKPIGQALTKGVRPLVEGFTKGLIPVLKTGLTGFAQLGNAILKGLLGFGKSAQGLSLIKQLLTGISAAMRPLGGVVAPLARALLQLSIAAIPGFKILIQALADAALRFSAFVAAGSKSGSFATAITKAVRITGQVITGFIAILKPVGSLLAQLGPAGISAFGALASVVGTAVAALTPFIIQLTQNRVLLAAVALAVAAFVGPVAAAVAAVALLVAAFQRFAGLRAFLAPITSGFADFSTSIQGAFKTVAPAVAGFVNALLPILLDFGRQIVGVIGPALRDIGEIIRTQVAPAFASFLTAVTPVAQFLLKVFGTAVVGALKGVVNVIKGVLVAISGIFNLVAGILTGDWSKAWLGIQQIAKGALRALLGVVQFALNVGILRLFRTAMTAARAVFTGGWAAIKALWSGALNGIKSLAGSVFKGIGSLIVTAVRTYLGAWRTGLTALFTVAKAVFSQVVGAFRGLQSQIVGTLRGIPAAMAAIGRQIVQGLVSGIRAAAGQVTAAAAAIANAIPGPIKKILHISSPSKVMIQLGTFVGAGLVKGLLGARADVATAAKSLGQKVRDAIRAYTTDRSGIARKIVADQESVRKAYTAYSRTLARVHQAAANAIANARRTLSNAEARYAQHRRGKDAPASVLENDRRAIADAQAKYQQTVKTQAGNSARALQAGRERINAALRKLAGDSKALRDLDVSFGNITKNPAKVAAVTKVIAKSVAALEVLAVKRTKNAAALKVSQDALNDAISIRTDYAKSVKDATLAFGGLTKAEAEEGKSLTAADVTKSLRERLAAIDLFRSQMDALKASGLSEDALKQLVDAGVDAGGATATALAEGGQEAIAQVNALTRSIAKAADDFGSRSGERFFAAGVNAAQGIADGLASDQAKLDAAAKSLAERLVAQVKKTLGIKSPSTVMAGLGENIGAGLAKGMASSEALVARASDRLSAVATPVPGPMTPDGVFGAGASKQIGPFNIYNPAPETVSESATRTARRLSALGLTA